VQSALKRLGESGSITNRTCTTASTTKEPSSPGSTMSSARLSIPLAGSGETRRARLPKDCAKGTNIFFGGGYGVGVETTRRLCLGPFTFRLARDDLATSRRLPDAPVRQFRFRPQRLKGEQPFMWDTSRLVSERRSSGRNPCGKIMGSLLSLEGVVIQRLLIPSQVHPITSLAITILFPVHFPLQSSRG
jgi:hypothetical protein